MELKSEFKKIIPPKSNAYGIMNSKLKTKTSIALKVLKKVKLDVEHKVSSVFKKNVTQI